MDLFAGAVNRENASDVLWVCDRCFKYMTDGTSWEVHMVRFGSPLSRAMQGVHVDLAGGHRGSVRASTHQAGRYINGVHTRFGRWMARRKRCVRLITLVAIYFSYEESSYIARICHSLENCLSTSKHFSSTAIIVRARVSVDRRALLIHSSSPILYLHRRRLPTGSCPWFLFKGNLLDLLACVPYLTRPYRKRYPMTTTTSRVSSSFPHTRRKVMECS